MLATNLRQRLRDPAYLELHFLACGIMRQQENREWYDSRFLKAFEAARAYLAQVSPDRVEAFIADFAPFYPPKDFRQVKVTDFLPAERLAEVRREVAAISQDQLDSHEIARFGRSILHDHPPFVALQHDLLDQVSDMAGMALEPGYTFLSLYGPDGVCRLHMDQPISMFTLDLCLDQSHDWPIHFSQPLDWQRVSEFGSHPTVASLEQLGIGFSSDVLKPNEALLFCGSAQWHYREPFARDGFCNLLFLHYYPAGCSKLIEPTLWAEHFAMPQLQPLCDLFAETELTNVSRAGMPG